MNTEVDRIPPLSQRGVVGMNLSFLFGCGVVLIVLVTELQQSVLPAGLSTQIGHNSEVWALALCLGAGIFMLERAEVTGTSRAPALVFALCCLGLAAAVYWLGTPATVRTLNEPLLAAALLVGYLSLPRPLPLMAPWLIAGAVGLVIVVWSQATPVFLQAEAVTALLVAPLTFDVVERWGQQTSPMSARWRALWLSFLVLVPALALASGEVRTRGGFGPDLVDYLARGAEGFWGIALLQLYFVLRGRRRLA